MTTLPPSPRTLSTRRAALPLVPALLALAACGGGGGGGGETPPPASAGIDAITSVTFHGTLDAAGVVTVAEQADTDTNPQIFHITLTPGSAALPAWPADAGPWQADLDLVATDELGNSRSEMVVISID